MTKQYINDISKQITNEYMKFFDKTFSLTYTSRTNLFHNNIEYEKKNMLANTIKALKTKKITKEGASKLLGYIKKINEIKLPK